MKINEVTEGLGQAFAASLARAVGADQAAGTIEKGRSGDSIFKPNGEMVLNFPPGIPDTPQVMTNPANSERIVNVFTAWAKNNGGKMAPGTVGAAIKNKFPMYWASEQNKGAVVSAIEKAVQAKGVKIAPASPADEKIRIGNDDLDPSDPLYKRITAKLSGK